MTGGSATAIEPGVNRGDARQRASLCRVVNSPGMPVPVPDVALEVSVEVMPAEHVGYACMILAAVGFAVMGILTAEKGMFVAPSESAHHPAMRAPRRRWHMHLFIKHKILGLYNKVFRAILTLFDF